MTSDPAMTRDDGDSPAASAVAGWAEQDPENVYRTRFLGHKFVSCGGPE